MRSSALSTTLLLCLSALALACSFKGGGGGGGTEDDGAPIDAGDEPLDASSDAAFVDAGCADSGDEDGDTVGNQCDNCPTRPNLDQNDVDQDGVGDECDPDDSAENRIAFIDFFDGDLTGWATPTTGSFVDNGWSVSNGVLRQDNISDETRVLERASLDFDDGLVELNFRVTDFDDGVTLNLVGPIVRFDDQGGNTIGYSCNEAKFDAFGGGGREYLSSLVELPSGDFDVLENNAGLEPETDYRIVSFFDGQTLACSRSVVRVPEIGPSTFDMSRTSGSIAIRTIATTAAFSSIVVYTTVE